MCWMVFPCLADTQEADVVEAAADWSALSFSQQMWAEMGQISCVKARQIVGVEAFDTAAAEALEC